VRVIAKLDAKPPHIVKPIHFEGLRKVGNPQEMAQQYYTQGVDEILYVDIVASLYRRQPIPDRVAQLSDGLFVPLAVGGGIRDLDSISQLFHVGADKVTMNTYPLQVEPEFIDQAARAFGSQAIVVAIEAKRWDQGWECYSDCGRERSGKDAIAWAQQAERRGAGELLIQSVDCDGRRHGFDIPLLQAIKQVVNIPVIAASGAGCVDHVLEMARQVRPDAVAVASLLHYDLATVAQLKSALAQEGL